MNLDGFHNRGRAILAPVIRLLASMGVSPSAVTVGGLLVCLGASWLAWKGLYWQAGVTMMAGSLFDALDGGIARLTGKVSKAGAALDSSLDRVAESALFIAILAGRAGSEHVTLLYAAPLALAGSLMVSYVRARSEGLGIRCDVGFFTRTERLVVMVVALLAAGAAGSVALLVGCVVVALGAWVTAVQRLITVYRAGQGQPL